MGPVLLGGKWLKAQCLECFIERPCTELVSPEAILDTFFQNHLESFVQCEKEWTAGVDGVSSCSPNWKYFGTSKVLIARLETRHRLLCLCAERDDNQTRWGRQALLATGYADVSAQFIRRHILTAQDADRIYDK